MSTESKVKCLSSIINLEDELTIDNKAGLDCYASSVYTPAIEIEEPEEEEVIEEPEHSLELIEMKDASPIFIVNGSMFGSIIDETRYGRDLIWDKNEHLAPKKNFRTVDWELLHGQGFDWELEKLLPDHIRHVYSTMGPNISYVNSHNMVFQARTKHFNMELLTDGCKLASDNNYEGVIVIDEYTNYNTRDIDVNKIVGYYRNKNHIDLLTPSIRPHVEFIIDVVKHRCDTLKLNFRIITFIPANDIIDNNYIYCPDVDLVFNFGVTDNVNNMQHPHSHNRMNKKYERSVNSNYSCITLIDYLSNSRSADPVYTYVSGEVNVIQPTYNPLVKEGIYTSLYRKGAMVFNKIIDLDDIEEHGFYKTRKACERAGNIKEQLELRKLGLEEKSLDFKHEELTHKYKALEVETDKLKNEREKYEYEGKKRVDEYNMYINKFKLELDLLRYKTNIEKDKVNNDMKFYLYKQKKEREKIDIDLQLLVLKEQIALSKDMFKFETDIYVANNKSQSDSITDKIKLMDLITKGISLLNIILK